MLKITLLILSLLPSQVFANSRFVEIISCRNSQVAGAVSVRANNAYLAYGKVMFNYSHADLICTENFKDILEYNLAFKCIGHWSFDGNNAEIDFTPIAEGRWQAYYISNSFYNNQEVYLKCQKWRLKQ